MLAEDASEKFLTLSLAKAVVFGFVVANLDASVYHVSDLGEVQIRREQFFLFAILQIDDIVV